MDAVIRQLTHLITPPTSIKSNDRVYKELLHFTTSNHNSDGPATNNGNSQHYSPTTAAGYYRNEIELQDSCSDSEKMNKLYNEPAGKFQRNKQQQLQHYYTKAECCQQELMAENTHIHCILDSSADGAKNMNHLNSIGDTKHSIKSDGNNINNNKNNHYRDTSDNANIAALTRAKATAIYLSTLRSYHRKCKWNKNNEHINSTQQPRLHYDNVIMSNNLQASRKMPPVSVVLPRPLSPTNRNTAGNINAASAASNSLRCTKKSSATSPAELPNSTISPSPAVTPQQTSSPSPSAALLHTHRRRHHQYQHQFRLLPSIGTTSFLTLITLICVETLLLTTVSDCAKTFYMHWNTSNSIFRIDNTDHIIDVNKGNLAFEFDQVHIICPVYEPGTYENETEKYIIYNVSKVEYETCRITNADPRVIAICDKPQKLMFFTITFRPFTPQPGGLEFLPGNDYYFISTSSKDDLYRRIGGRCSTNNMKVVFKVCCAPEENNRTTSVINTNSGGMSGGSSGDTAISSETFITDAGNANGNEHRQSTAQQHLNSIGDINTALMPGNNAGNNNNGMQIKPLNGGNVATSINTNIDQFNRIPLQTHGINVIGNNMGANGGVGVDRSGLNGMGGGGTLLGTNHAVGDVPSNGIGIISHTNFGMSNHPNMGGGIGGSGTGIRINNVPTQQQYHPQYNKPSGNNNKMNTNNDDHHFNKHPNEVVKNEELTYNSAASTVHHKLPTAIVIFLKNWIWSCWHSLIYFRGVFDNSEANIAPTAPTGISTASLWKSMYDTEDLQKLVATNANDDKCIIKKKIRSKYCFTYVTTNTAADTRGNSEDVMAARDYDCAYKIFGYNNKYNNKSYVDYVKQLQLLYNNIFKINNHKETENADMMSPMCGNIINLVACFKHIITNFNPILILAILVLTAAYIYLITFSLVGRNNRFRYCNVTAANEMVITAATASAKSSEMKDDKSQICKMYAKDGSGNSACNNGYNRLSATPSTKLQKPEQRARR